VGGVNNNDKALPSPAHLLYREGTQEEVMEMTTKLPLSLVGLLFALATWLPSEALAGGDLQVVCVPGVQIYIDGNFKGTTSKNQGGLFVEGLSAGQHRLLAKLSGAADQTKNFTILQGKLKTITLTFVQQRMRVESLESTDSAAIEVKTGTLEIRAVPPYPKPSVKIDGKHQGSGDIKVSGVAVGYHTVEWNRGGKTVSTYVGVCADQTVSLKADFRSQRVSEDSPCIPVDGEHDGPDEGFNPDA